MAQVLFKAWMRSLGQSDDSPSLASLLDEWHAVGEVNGSADQSRRNRREVESFMEFSGAGSVEEFDRLMIERWIVFLSKEFSTKTVKNKLSGVLGFLRWCEDHEFLTKAPRVQQPKLEKLPPRYLSEADIKTALQLAKEHDCFLEIYISLKTGVRLGELRLMDWSDFLWDQKVLIVPKTKSKRPRSIPLPADAIKTLKPMTREGLVFPGRTYAGCCGLRDKHTFLERVRPVVESIDTFRDRWDGKRTGRAYHLLRHTYGVVAAKAGVPIPLIKEWMGHTDINTTMIYAQFSEDQYNSQVEKLNGSQAQSQLPEVFFR